MCVDDTILLGIFKGPLPGKKAKPHKQEAKPACLLDL